MTEAHSPVSSGGLTDCRPILCVESAVRSIDYYVNCLQFRLSWAWSTSQQKFLEPGEAADVGFALVVRGRVQIMLSQQSQGAPGMWLHLDVDTGPRVDALFREWAAAGAFIDEPPQLRPWGMYEMRVRDPDGHVLRVSSSPP